MAGNNVWLRRAGVNARAKLMAHTSHALKYEVLQSEKAVGREMLAEIEAAARANTDDLTIVILGGRGPNAPDPPRAPRDAEKARARGGVGEGAARLEAGV